jgi:Asp-tRNA(Asn)/Glu-tRNA(Gln) amidotransferase C subunit
MSKEPTINIEEFRKITGFASTDMDDSTIADVVSQLELIADIYINQTKETDTGTGVPNSTHPS